MSNINPNASRTRMGNNNLEEPSSISDGGQQVVTEGELFQGVIDASTNPNYPAASENMFWKISVAGKIGGVAGEIVKVGDQVICIKTNAGGVSAAVGTDFMIEEGKTYIGVPPTPVVRTNSPIIAANTVNANISALDTAIGVTPTSLNTILAANSVNANLSLLDAALQNEISFNHLSASINGAGNNQGTATVIGSGIAVVGAADGTVGVKLPALAVGKSVTIFNIVAAQDLKVYGNAAETVNGAASKKFSHATDVSSVVCTRASATDWLMTAIHGTIS